MTSSFLFLFADLPFAFIFLIFMWVLAGPIVWVPMTLLPVGIILGLALRGPIERYTALNVQESNERNGLLVEGARQRRRAAEGRGRRVGDRGALARVNWRVAHGDLKVKFFSYLAVNLGQLLNS